jgi:thiol-disulfide isomerase/thioredoxin
MFRNASVGRAAHPAVATHWYNASPPTISSSAAPGARQLPNGDGKIRVLEFGGLGCSDCLAALPIMQKIREQFSDVDVWYLSQSEQRWGATEATPDEAAEHIYKYYVVHHKSKVPMGVWAPPADDTTREPGAKLQRLHPTFEAYQIGGIPVFVVIDGRGNVRRIMNAGPQLQETLVETITYLLAEASRTSNRIASQ